MSKEKTFKTLDAWIKAVELCKEIYALTKEFPTSEQFGLTNQIRRASVSIPSNIAEGYGRQYKKETLQFLHVAKGSMNELETQLILACELDFLEKTKMELAINNLETTRRFLIGFMTYLENNSNLK